MFKSRVKDKIVLIPQENRHKVEVEAAGDLPRPRGRQQTDPGLKRHLKRTVTGYKSSSRTGNRAEDSEGEPTGGGRTQEWQSRGGHWEETPQYHIQSFPGESKRAPSLARTSSLPALSGLLLGTGDTAKQTDKIPS